MRDPEIIDAEFEVVREPDAERHGWNGIGLPPEWREWGWFPRLVFVVVYAVLAWWALMFAIELKALIPLVLH